MKIKGIRLKAGVRLAQGMILAIISIFPEQTGFCKTLFFEDIISQVIAKSYDIEIAKIDKEIGKHKRMEARAQYFPTLSVRLNDEYYKDLTVPGETVIHTDITGYKNSLSLYADYNLFDFGAREMRYRNASRDVKIAEHSIKKQLIDTKINTLFVYKKGLTLSKKIKAQTTIFKYKTKIYDLSKRLHQAGKFGRIDLAESAIMVAEAAQDLDDLQMDWENTLHELTYYTGQPYDSDRTDFFDFSEPKPVEYAIQINDMPEIKIYDIEIEKKRAEFYMMTTQWLPKFSLYSSYQFYGYDPSSFSNSFDDMKEEEYRIGLKVDLNLFNGFGDFAKARQLRAELRKLQLERGKKIAEQKQLLNTLKTTNTLYLKQLKKWQKYEADISEKSSMDERLAKQKITDQPHYLRKQIEEIEKRLKVEVKDIDRIATNYHLQFLAEGGGHPVRKGPGRKLYPDQFIAERNNMPKRKGRRKSPQPYKTQMYYLDPLTDKSILNNEPPPKELMIQKGTKEPRIQGFE